MLHVPLRMLLVKSTWGGREGKQRREDVQPTRQEAASSSQANWILSVRRQRHFLEHKLRECQDILERNTLEKKATHLNTVIQLALLLSLARLGKREKHNPFPPKTLKLQNIDFIEKQKLPVGRFPHEGETCCTYPYACFW